MDFQNYLVLTKLSKFLSGSRDFKPSVALGGVLGLRSSTWNAQKSVWPEGRTRATAAQALEQSFGPPPVASYRGLEVGGGTPLHRRSLARWSLPTLSRAGGVLGISNNMLQRLENKSQDGSR